MEETWVLTTRTCSRHLLNLNKNKNASSSSSKNECCQRESVNIKISFTCIDTNATPFNKKVSYLKVRVALEGPDAIRKFMS